jgi:hypothetical protein
MMQFNIKKIICCCAPIFGLSTFLSGCGDLQEEKPYEYYTLHPSELYHDYKYCETHPSAGVCINIVKKYFQYKKNIQGGTSAPSSADPYWMSRGYIFRNIDEPISSFGIKS